MSNIRVTYSGLISLTVGIVSVLTGTIFTLIVTRRLTPDEFGTWGLIGSLIGYVLIIEPIISYWSTRETARKINSAGTAVFSSAIFSSIGILAYIIIAFFVIEQSYVINEILFLAVILIPLMFLNKTLTAINIGWRPEASSYGVLIFEIIKIPTAIIFVVFLDLGVSGAIIATTIAYGGSIILLLKYAKEKIISQINFKFLKIWIKRSWLPLYPGIASLVFSLDLLVFTLITGSVIGLAYYSAAVAISSLVAQSGSISQAIYPKLLQGGKKDHLQENLIQFLYFGFPLLAISLILAKPGLFALNPIYSIAIPVVIFMTIRTFIYKLGGILEQSLQGIETVDIDEKSTFKQFARSKLFWIPTLRLFRFCIYTVTLTIVLLIFNQHRNVIELVVYWSIISMLVEIPFLIYLSYLTKKNFVIKIPKIIILKYSGSSLISFGITYFLMNEFLIYENKIFEFLPNVIMYVGLGITLYLGITYLIDSKTKSLMKSVIKEFKLK